MITKEQLTQLRTLQKELDSKIIVKKIMINKNLSASFLALIVEISEFANEKRCFKYWSSQKEATKNILLEEYIDILHFILSIANKLQLPIEPSLTKIKTLIMIDETNNNYDKLNLILLQLIKKAIVFYDCQSAANLNDLWNTYWAVGKICCFSDKEIYNAYIAKNIINHQRQKQNY